jgi:hypothetical protein
MDRIAYPLWDDCYVVTIRMEIIDGEKSLITSLQIGSEVGVWSWHYGRGLFILGDRDEGT